MRFVLIDQLIELEPGTRAVARVTFPPHHEIFEDHFPGLPIVPGVLVVEAMGQAGGWLIAATLGFSRWPLLTMIDGAKFRRLVNPGDELRLEVALRSARERDFEVSAQAKVGSERVAGARLYFHAFEFSPSRPQEGNFEAWVHSTFRAIGGEDLLARADRQSSERPAGVDPMRDGRGNMKTRAP